MSNTDCTIPMAARVPTGIDAYAAAFAAMEPDAQLAVWNRLACAMLDADRGVGATCVGRPAAKKGGAQ